MADTTIMADPEKESQEIEIETKSPQDVKVSNEIRNIDSGTIRPFSSDDPSDETHCEVADVCSLLLSFSRWMGWRNDGASVTKDPVRLSRKIYFIFPPGQTGEFD